MKVMVEVGGPDTMTMSPRVRRFALTAHVTCSVGWVGAVVVFLALAGIGLTSQDAQAVRGVYLVMEPAAWFVLVPFAFASLVTGIVMSLGTTWGLFQHYWVVFKLLITVFATSILMIYMGTFRAMATIAADPAADLDVVRNAFSRASCRAGARGVAGGGCACRVQTEGSHTVRTA
jgi:uncharacterized membrane protein